MASYHDEIWAAVPERRPFDTASADWVRDAIDAAGGPRTLDLGCGDGRLTARLAEAGARVTGVDPSRVAIERARAAHPELDWAQSNPDGSLPFEDSTFEAATCVNVLEHVADTQRLISELRRVLAPGARVAIAVPANGWARTALRGPRAFKRSHDPLEPVLRFYTRRTLRDLLKRFGFEQLRIERSRSTLLAAATRG
ncbi:MAG: class I SAM-dependent methyltransferase [Solirubrobacterales bacterium]